MLQRLLLSAVFAGLAAGVVAAALQFAFVVPLLLEGELFEAGVVTHFVPTENGAIETPVTHVPLAGEIGRHAGTLAMTLVTYTGFALLMVVGFALAERRGLSVDARSGLLWGVSGFLAVQLAPAAGLPPELPGTIAAELAARQAWWVGTVVASLAGIALIAFGGLIAGLVGAILILLPHLVGAPQLDTYYGIAPPELSAHFATRSLAVAAASWAVLGTAAGALWARD